MRASQIVDSLLQENILRKAADFFTPKNVDVIALADDVVAAVHDFHISSALSQNSDPLEAAFIALECGPAREKFFPAERKVGRRLNMLFKEVVYEKMVKRVLAYRKNYAYN